MPDTAAVVHKRAKLTEKDNYSTWSVSTEMALKRFKAWKVIKDAAPAQPDFYDDDAKARDTACRDWLLETLEEAEVITQKVTANRKKFRRHYSYSTFHL
jgi:hypothetical protein